MKLSKKTVSAGVVAIFAVAGYFGYRFGPEVYAPVESFLLGLLNDIGGLAE